MFMAGIAAANKSPRRHKSRTEVPGERGMMSTLWPDTHPEIERLQVERLRKMPSWRKVTLMTEMAESVRALALAGLRQRYPTDTPVQRRRRLADLLLGPELAALAYGPPPEEG